MKKILFFFLIAFASKVFGQSKSYDYCYTNKKGTCVYSIADKKDYVVVKGVSDPSLSPDGTKLVYTANLKDGGRTIKVIDISTKKKTILNTQSNNCYGAVWSPDGNYIAYNVFNQQTSKWAIAVIDAGNNTPFHIVTGQLEDAFAPTWTSDSKNIVVQNLDNVFVLGLSGNVIKTFKVADLTNTDGPSSSDKFIFTGDGSKIVFSSEVNEASDTDGPPTAVFIYDIAGKSTKRLSPKGYFADGIVIKNDKIFFTASKFKSHASNIYTVDTDGKNFSVLFSNCSGISAKTQ